MNEITKASVTETARKHKAVARRNDDEFAQLVEQEYWLLIMLRIGWVIKSKLILKHRERYPDAVDDEGFLLDYDVDVEISDRANEEILREIENRPGLQLQDWGEFPETIGRDGQYKLL